MSEVFEEHFREEDYKPGDMTRLRRMITVSDNLSVVCRSWSRWIDTAVNKSVARDNTFRKFLHGLDPEPNIWTIMAHLDVQFDCYREAIDPFWWEPIGGELSTLIEDMVLGSLGRLAKLFQDFTYLGAFLDHFRHINEETGLVSEEETRTETEEQVTYTMAEIIERRFMVNKKMTFLELVEGLLFPS